MKEEGKHYLGIQQRIWLTKVASKHQDWLDSIGFGDERIVHIHGILTNDYYMEYDVTWLNTLRDMYIKNFCI